MTDATAQTYERYHAQKHHNKAVKKSTDSPHTAEQRYTDTYLQGLTF